MAYEQAKRDSVVGFGMSDAASAAAAVTPSDTVELSNYAKALWIGGAGNVSVIMASDRTPNGVPVTFTGCTAGSILPVAVRRVNAALTTATLIVALFDTR